MITKYNIIFNEYLYILLWDKGYLEWRTGLVPTSAIITNIKLVLPPTSLPQFPGVKKVKVPGNGGRIYYILLILSY